MAANSLDEALAQVRDDTAPDASAKPSEFISDTERPEVPKGMKPKVRNTKIKTSLEKTYGTLGMMLYPLDQICGAAIIENSEAMAESLAQLAEENAAVKRLLLKLSEGSAVATVIAAHMPLIVAVASHHAPQVAGLIHRDKTAEDNETE